MAVEPDAATAALSGIQYRFDGGLFRAGSWFKAGALIAFRPVFDALEHASDASYYGFSRCWSTDDAGDNASYVR
jgi:hypothetical protein